MVQDHVVGVDLCVVGERGVGKTLVIRDFAAALGYRCRTVFCYKDMGARDLTMRRVTDARGNTEWRRSPLIEAALDGGLAVLDGAHRLAPGVLRSTLGRLLSDREIQLPDGTRLVAPAAYAALREIYDDAALQAKGVLRAHPAFRVVCAGEPPSAHNPWISAELAGLMHYHALAPLSSAEQTSLVRHALEAGGAGEPRALAAGEERALLDYGDALRRAVATESILEPLLLTARRLAQIGAHLRSRPQDGVEDAVDHIFAAYQDFLPAPKRATARRMLRDALVTRGVPTAKERGGASFGRRVSRKRDRAASARCHVAPCVTFGAGSTFYLGDAAGEKRSPRRRDLVPRPPFVEMAAHMWALRDMLVDWSLGRHLLLIGNQGVGKNKLADRLLQLLDAEREYVQLHRDTTVQALTASPTLKGGVVVWEDSPSSRPRATAAASSSTRPTRRRWRSSACSRPSSTASSSSRTAGGSRPRRRATPAPTPRRTPRRARRATCPWRRASASSSSRTGRASLLGNDFYRECGDAFACHAVENADEASEVQMLRRYGPGVPVKRVVKLTQAFKKLRAMYDDGAISYPYSSRELVKLVQHLDRFPADGLRGAVADVFGFDAQDPQLHAKLMSGAAKATQDGVVSEAPTDRDADPSPAPPPRDRRGAAPGGSDSTKTPAGEGSGEAKAAEAQALGFRTGPPRPAAPRTSACSRRALGREARRERTWKRLQTHGELDELMLVDGITGATNIYKRRSPDDAARLLSQQLPKRIKFVLDISGSMYTYNRLDGRLTRVLQALIMLMEALDGFEHKYEYSVVGHSGAASAVLLVPWASPPKTRLERLKLVRKMVNHAQTCKSGDHTLQATKRAVADVAAKAADEYFAAEAIKDELPPGKGFSCYDTSKLIGTLRDIFQASILAARVTDDFAAALDVDPDAAANAPNTAARDVRGGHFVRPLALSPLGAPRLLAFSNATLALLGLDAAEAARPEFLAVFAGGDPRAPALAPLHAAPWATPYALSIYGSEQVTDGGVGDGYGDGRASLFVAGAWEAQLKGSGPTPFRRRGDGFAVVRSSTRDDRTAVDDDFQPVRHGGDVLRRERRAITTRVARSFVRVGSLELFARRLRRTGERARRELEALFRYAYDREGLGPAGAALEDAAVAAATETRGRFASLACHWLRVGYAQSNYNSDNSLVGGATVDYGPFGFVERPRGATGRRSSTRCARSRAAATPRSTPRCGAGRPRRGARRAMRAAKLGLVGAAALAAATVDGAVRWDRVDARGRRGARALGAGRRACRAGRPTRTTRSSGGSWAAPRATDGAAALGALGGAWYDAPDADLAAAWRAWLDDWRALGPDAAAMDAANPAFVPREWMLVEAYEAAERGDGAVVDRLAALFRRPYAEDQAQADSEAYFRRAPDDAHLTGGVGWMS
ncbi:ATPase [Aureococcus anophagefferens]|nr:ATPase [Aureococcus anophagefferens]